jgi:hypothetical protein
VATVPVLIGESGGRPAILGELPEPTATERDVHAFVESLVDNGQLEVDETATGSGAERGVPRVTHRVRSVGGQKTLRRVRFHAGS